MLSHLQHQLHFMCKVRSAGLQNWLQNKGKIVFLRSQFTTDSRMAFEVREATTDEEILACWDTVRALRPHVKEENFLPQIRKQQAEGYRLMYIENPEVKKVQSICGFREYTMLWSGRTIYIDDLSTLPEGRGKGYGGALLDWVIKYYKDNGFDNLGLDSGHTRHTAHRLYLNKGFDINSHHFVYTGNN
ncbi:unnamed protein product [Allacma fusca]|uniref:N-acetyltransferase domain-containing protein n=1 Tax=Allacma fusca TaxID=39272 RepID=A0A8J2KXY3_9HEXA|nr:unnamed protein product [Allacma fusca]